LPINAHTAAFARNQAIVDEKAARIAVTENGGDSHQVTVTAPTTTSPCRPMPRPDQPGGAFPHPTHRQHQRRHHRHVQ
jgi:hypothetical protein